MGVRAFCNTVMPVVECHGRWGGCMPSQSCRAAILDFRIPLALLWDGMLAHLRLSRHAVLQRATVRGQRQAMGGWETGATRAFYGRYPVSWRVSGAREGFMFLVDVLESGESHSWKRAKLSDRLVASASSVLDHRAANGGTGISCCMSRLAWTSSSGLQERPCGRSAAVGTGCIDRRDGPVDTCNLGCIGVVHLVDMVCRVGPQIY